MKALFKKLSVMFLSLPLLVSKILPVYATGTIIDIQPNGSNGLTIKPPGNGEAPPDMGQDLGSFQSAIEKTLMPTVEGVAGTIVSVCTVVSLVAFLISVTKLATSAGNPAARQRALQGILFSGVALALFGGAWTVVTFFWDFL